MRTSKDVTECPTYTNTLCIIYTGVPLPNLGINPGDDVTGILEDINAILPSYCCNTTTSTTTENITTTTSTTIAITTTTSTTIDEDTTTTTTEVPTTTTTTTTEEVTTTTTTTMVASTTTTTTTGCTGTFNILYNFIVGNYPLEVAEPQFAIYGTGYTPVNLSESGSGSLEYSNCYDPPISGILFSRLEPPSNYPSLSMHILITDTFDDSVIFEQTIINPVAGYGGDTIYFSISYVFEHGKEYYILAECNDSSITTTTTTTILN